MSGRYKFKMMLFTLIIALIIVMLFIYFHNFKPEFTEVYSNSSNGTIKETHLTGFA